MIAKHKNYRQMKLPKSTCNLKSQLLQKGFQPSYSKWTALLDVLDSLYCIHSPYHIHTRYPCLYTVSLMYVRVTTVVELNQNNSKRGNPRSNVTWFRQKDTTVKFLFQLKKHCHFNYI